jgi:Uma2 family endonuclease
MGTAPAPIPRVTHEQLERMGDLGPCELIDGRIVPSSPTGDEHGSVELNLAAALRAFVREQRLGHVRVGEVGVVTRRQPDTVRGADVLYISNARYARRGRRTGYLDVAPELVAEVLSPWDKPAELRHKLAEYFEAGVLVVWVLDPARRTVRVHSAPNHVVELREGDTLTGGDVLPGFTVPVVELFAE